MFVNKLYKSFLTHDNRNAFCINDVFFTYSDLSKRITAIRFTIRKHAKKGSNVVGLITNDDLETYASIFALWMEGMAYVPINPDAPHSRNLQILMNVEAKYILDSSNVLNTFDNLETIDSKVLDSQPSEKLSVSSFNSSNIAYILFTSGSTGEPKGIPISFSNLDSLLNSVVNDTNFVLSPEDRCLQMYDLTFDASFTALLPGLFAGACIYTVPAKSIKYLHIFKLLLKHRLTVIKMVPSIIHYLRPYFKEISASYVRYCIFGGGKLYEDILLEWVKCIPNSKVLNHYGPTEFTVCSGYYEYIPNKATKTHNGVVAIGEPWAGVKSKIIDENNNETNFGEMGELCLAGNQLTSGYWKNEKLNNTQFFYEQSTNGKQIKFYKTGDICFKDEEGDIFYVDRKDFQVKIRGNRVELGEIEFHAKQFLKGVDLIIIDIVNDLNNTELAMVIVSKPFDLEEIKVYLAEKLPNYMIPTKYKFLQELPLNQNGKIDRKLLKVNF